ncbi:MAG TPA: hypothetical protein VGD39_18515, partial [Nocardioides sp.]
MRTRTGLGVVAAATLVTTLATTLGAVPAQADDARTLTGPGTGASDVFLTYVGCSDLFAPAVAPQSRINLGPYDAPLGRRSLGLVPSVQGTASGPFARFASLDEVGSTLSVASTSGTEGVSYVMAITASSPPGTAWSGRATLQAAPGAWTTVSAAALDYEWHLVDLTSLAEVAPAGTATPAAFAAEHGDGAGFVVTGFGCDGQSFNLDAVRGAGSTFDFEGTTLTTHASADRTRVDAGDQVTISGRVTDPSGRVTGDPLVLESRTPGGQWVPVGKPVVGGSGLARVDVRVTETTDFRWHRPESQYADEGWSDAVTVTVVAPATTQEPTQRPTQQPTQEPTQEPT